MNKTPIEWCKAMPGRQGYTWQVTRGCHVVSPGCKHCYAQTIAGRFSGAGFPFEGFATKEPGKVARWTGKVATLPDQLDEPLRVRKPGFIFVNSMSDLFHDDVPFDYIAAAFGVMAACPQHVFQVLTKRAERMAEWFEWFAANAHHGTRADEIPNQSPWPLPNVWIGVSVEDRAHKSRIDNLRKCPAVVRAVSFEPLLEDLGTLDLTGIHWVIAGGESGPGARTLRPEWIRGIVSQAITQGVAPFVKQMGARIVDRNDVGFDAESDTYVETGLPVCMEAWPTPRDVKHDIHGHRDDFHGADVLVQLKSKKGVDPQEWPADLRVREVPNV